jgi:hypothetical protein
MIPLKAVKTQRNHHAKIGLPPSEIIDNFSDGQLFVETWNENCLFDRFIHENDRDSG